MVELADGACPAAPVVHLRWLSRVDASELKKCQAANRILRKLNASIQRPCRRPLGPMLYDQRGPMDRGMRRAVPDQQASAAKQNC